ncbi:NEAT domain-containing protein [Paenibacillus macerans]|uniref:NEAT domain-containing protein n=1 Tax=Paenibacillus macerans TaxID=44252 RepID=UPI00203E4C2F|nr:NEAT domain-containing protein [Paenibacillus macerans]MCM3701196.1 NEAT domain-containing protein [Paenibacillus macerans]
MNRLFSKSAAAVFAIAVLLLSLFPQAPARAASDLADGVYSIDYTILKDGTTQASVMETYVEKPGTLTVDNGVQYVSFTLKQSKEITSFQVEQDGALQETVTLSTYEEGNTRDIQFQVDDLSATLNGYVTIEWPEFNYFNSYDVDLAFDTDSITLISGGDPDDNPSTGNPDDTPSDDGLADGKYSIGYTILKDGTTEISVMDGYTVKPGTLTVKDGVQYVSFTLKQSKEITSFKVEQDGQLQETVTLSTYEAENTRDIQFKVDDLSAALNGYVTIAWPEFNYFNSYDVDLKFDTDNITPIDNGGNPGDNPSTGNPPVVNPPVVNPPVVNPPVVNPPEGPIDPDNLANGKYTIMFKFLKYGTSSPSVMDGYVQHPAILEVSGSNYYIYMTFKQSEEITGFKVGDDEADTIGTDETANTRVVKFRVDDLKEIVDAWVKIDWPEYNYFNSYDVQIQFYPDSIDELDAADDFTLLNGTMVTPVAKQEFVLKNGKYSIGYTILKDGTQETAEINEYAVHPGTLVVQDGKQQVSFEVKQSEEIVSFKTKQNGTLTETKTLSEDKANNTRVVGFEVANLSSALDAWVRIKRPEGYFSEYDLQVKFDVDSITSLSNTVDAVNTDNTGNTEEETATAPAASPSRNFTDTEGHWAKENIARAAALGIVTGYADGSFRPDVSASRSELAVMLSRALQLDSREPSLPFADKDNFPGWSQEGIGRAVSAGIISGYEDGTFRPQARVTRTETTVMIVRAMNGAEGNAGKPGFKDAGEIPEWAIPQVSAAARLGLAQGGPQQLFAPNAQITRAEAVTLILNMLDAQNQS